MQAIDCGGLQLDSPKGQPWDGAHAWVTAIANALCVAFSFFSLSVSEGVRRGASKGGRDAAKAGGE